MSLYISLPRVDNKYIDDHCTLDPFDPNKGKVAYKIYNNAWELFRCTNLESWDDAYPTLVDAESNMSDADRDYFAHRHASDVYDYIPKHAIENFKEYGVWDTDIDASNVDKYNDAIRDTVWNTVDRIVDELVKYLGLDKKAVA